MSVPRVVDPADPRRCTAATLLGQCFNISSEGTNLCPIHGRKELIPPRQRLYLLHRADIQQRLDELADHDAVKSLREEVALARIMTEMAVNKIKKDEDLAIFWPAVEKGLQTTHRLVKDCFLIEQNLGAMISKVALLKFAQAVVQAVIDRLQGIDNYEEIVDEIIQDVSRALRGAVDVEPVRSISLLEPPK